MIKQGTGPDDAIVKQPFPNLLHVVPTKVVGKAWVRQVVRTKKWILCGRLQVCFWARAAGFWSSSAARVLCWDGARFGVCSGQDAGSWLKASGSVFGVCLVFVCLLFRLVQLLSLVLCRCWRCSCHCLVRCQSDQCHCTCQYRRGVQLWWWQRKEARGCRAVVAVAWLSGSMLGHWAVLSGRWWVGLAGQRLRWAVARAQVAVAGDLGAGGAGWWCGPCASQSNFSAWTLILFPVQRRRTLNQETNAYLSWYHSAGSGWCPPNPTAGKVQLLQDVAHKISWFSRGAELLYNKLPQILRFNAPRRDVKQSVNDVYVYP